MSAFLNQVRFLFKPSEQIKWGATLLRHFLPYLSVNQQLIRELRRRKFQNSKTNHESAKLTWSTFSSRNTTESSSDQWYLNRQRQRVFLQTQRKLPEIKINSRRNYFWSNKFRNIRETILFCRFRNGSKYVIGIRLREDFILLIQQN